jgi:hypothetical protein
MKKKFVQGIIFKTIIDTTKKDPPPITSLMALMVPPKTGDEQSGIFSLQPITCKKTAVNNLIRTKSLYCL